MTMARVRRIGNSSGVILPQSFLSQLHVNVGDPLSLTLEDGRIVLAPAPVAPRAGWAEASKALVEAGQDELVWPDFSNAEDGDLTW